MEKDESEIEVGSDLGNNSTRQEKTSEHSLGEECRYEEISRAIKEGKPHRINWEVVPMRTLELMRKRGLIILDDDEEKMLETDTSGSGKRRRVEQEHSSDLNETGSAEEIVLPFTKTLDSWKEYELDEVYKRTPQRPHFRPLFYSRQIFREWVASSLTGAFIHLLKKVDDDLGEDAPRSELDDYKEAIDLLEEHGFDVKAPLSRINELLSVKNGLPNILEEQKGMEKEMTVECSKEPKLNKSLVRCRSFFEDKGTAN